MATMIPAQLRVPKMKLEEGEEIEATMEALRKKGIFGNRYGHLVLTNKRVAFVKAVAGGLVMAVATKGGAKPMLSFERDAVSGAEKLTNKKMHHLVLSSGATAEKFWMDEATIDALIPKVAPR
ncbi:MAG: hypothetical protein KC635_28705 [Myxococcales bacterium]|nr:hypothetical protein [Myxococcales bacterium]MCB9732381.1 hypothetical protein [Deltaproteobacteria bacterium]